MGKRLSRERNRAVLPLGVWLAALLPIAPRTLQAQAALPIEPGEAVASCRSWDGSPPLPAPLPYVVGIIDIRDPDCAAGAALGTHWAAPMYHNEMPNPTGNPADEWTHTNLGQVFGIALDDLAAPNIYVTSTSAYLRSSGSGHIYRLDGLTGAISVFAILPNSGQGLGNIAFDRAHRQFFVTDHEDGKLYRIDRAGVVHQMFDPFLPDDGRPGFAPLGERLWGVGVFESRVYFAVWSEDALRHNVATKGRCELKTREQ